MRKTENDMIINITDIKTDSLICIKKGEILPVKIINEDNGDVTKILGRVCDIEISITNDIMLLMDISEKYRKQIRVVNLSSVLSILNIDQYEIDCDTVSNISVSEKTTLSFANNVFNINDIITVKALTYKSIVSKYEGRIIFISDNIIILDSSEKNNADIKSIYIDNITDIGKM